jgi:glycogen debranching enzyme
MSNTRSNTRGLLLAALLSGVGLLSGCTCGTTKPPDAGLPTDAGALDAGLPDAGLALRAPTLGELGIDVSPTASRAFFQTNKGDAYLYGEAAGPHSSSYQGFNVRGFTFIDDWQWVTAAGNLGSSAFGTATVFPDHAVRRYDGGVSEEVTVFDGERALVVEPSAPGELTLRPLFADSTKASTYQVNLDGGVLAIARVSHLVQNGPNDFPVWLVVQSAHGVPSADPLLLPAGGLKPVMMSPGSLKLAQAEPVVFAVGETLAEATATAQRVLADVGARKAARAARLQALLDASAVATEDARFNKALAWLRLSMDALVMNQQGKGIFAGLPWFNNYWGRDTFISLAGSHLVTGQWEEAKEILRSFSTHQDVDPSSATFGRIPNIVSLGGTAYNTADGTPWFVLQAAAVVARSGDGAFAAELWPVIKRATQGSLAHVDAQGFVLHGDQETWMDATGPDGPYTPRADRAVEIEGLFVAQLEASAALADLVGEAQLATAWRAHAQRVADAVLPTFFDAVRVTLADRLKPDGGLDQQVRPNQLIALAALGAHVPADQAQRITRSAAGRLVYPHGVASLTPVDDFFHPYHVMPGYYPKDEAYHNGVVWCWLSGPLVSLMVAQGAGEKAWQQLDALNALALDRGTVGTLPELMDALPRLEPDTMPLRLGQGLPMPAGTPFQAWSHGEYLRNVYEDFVGVRYLSSSHVQLSPSLPTSWGRTQARFRVGDGGVVATFTPDAGVLDVDLRGEGALPGGTTVTVKALGLSQDVTVASGGTVHAHLAGTVTPATAWAGFDWRIPELRGDLPTLQTPGVAVLDRAIIKKPAAADVRLRLTLADPAGDDTGPAGEQYTYPTDTHFAPGMLDLRGFTLKEDSEAFYFTITFDNLVQPGWNPADGFQLTYAAVLFDTGAPVRRTKVAHKAGYELPADAGFDYAVYVGAGLEVQDATGKPIAAYTPQTADVVDPLGSVDTKTISFRIPKTVLPAIPAGTTVTLLGGSQDDYGNGSMGDFRAVDVTATQWTGGGKTVNTDPNVYDFAAGTAGP